MSQASQLPSAQSPTEPRAAQVGPATLGELRESGYTPRSVKQELRQNTLIRLSEVGEAGPFFPGLLGYDQSVVPELVNALLAGHDTLLLGLRGQAKTRLLRSLTMLLDEWIPIIDPSAGAAIADDPVNPVTTRGRRIVEELGDSTPIRWLHRSDRYHEKLATPDVTTADLLGEVDIVKHAQGIPLDDDRALHMGLIPRSNRGIFAINELPDLTPRIQVSLFNVLEERDIQIRGFPVRMPLDLAIFFSANPEDYTNRGRIVTPLKDRIGSVVRTHYPRDLSEAMRITRENAYISRGSSQRPAAATPAVPSTPSPGPRQGPPSVSVHVPDVMHEIIETAISMARRSPHVNQASGVSVRAAIAALECAVSAAESRAIRAGEASAILRPSDLSAVRAALRGKVELMLSDEASDEVIAEDRLTDALMGEALREVLDRYADVDRYEAIRHAFDSGLRLELSEGGSTQDTLGSLRCVDPLHDAAVELAEVLGIAPDDDNTKTAAVACAGELVLELLYVHKRLSKVRTRTGAAFRR